MNTGHQVENLGAYRRRDNLQFYQIPEVNNEDTEKVLRNFIQGNFRLGTENIEFSIHHRFDTGNGKRQGFTEYQSKVC